MRWPRFFVVSLAAAIVGGLLVDFVRPERRFRSAEVTAAVQVRVVRNAAPTVESLERKILNNDELEDLWDDFFAAEAGSASSRREAELVAWRRRLRVEVDSGPIGDLRSIRVTWTGLEDIDMGAAIVESLARRYADEVSAERWYGSVDRLRAQVREVETAAKELAAASARPPTSAEVNSSVAPAASFEPVPDERMNAPLLIAPNADGAVPAAVEKPKPKKFAFPPAPARNADDPAARISTAAANLRRQMDDMLLPQQAEFPVVTLDRVGLNVAHLRPLWFGCVGLLSLVLAGLVSVSRVASLPAAVPPMAPLAAENDAAEKAAVENDDDEVTVGPPAHEPRVVPIRVATKPVVDAAADPPNEPPEMYFHSSAEVEARLAAPVLAVVSRRQAAPPVGTVRPHRRAA